MRTQKLDISDMVVWTPSDAPLLEDTGVVVGIERSKLGHTVGPADDPTECLYTIVWTNGRRWVNILRKNLKLLAKAK